MCNWAAWSPPSIRPGGIPSRRRMLGHPSASPPPSSCLLPLPPGECVNGGMHSLLTMTEETKSLQSGQEGPKHVACLV